MKILFAGTPFFAATILEKLVRANLKPLAVWSQPDRPQGRGKKLQPCPTKSVALSHYIPTHQPLNFKSAEAIAQMQDYQPDLLIVAAYGLILPQNVLNIPRLGCINVHASLLPLWRGAAPIARAIWNGCQETGITLMQMDAGLDTGATLVSQSIPILPNDTGASLHDRLAELGGDMTIQLLKDWKEGISPTPIPQPPGATYAHKLSKEDGLLCWQQSVLYLERQIRALTPWPGTFTLYHGERIKILSAKIYSEHPSNSPAGTIIETDNQLLVATTDGVLSIETLQFPGKKALTWQQIMHGGTPLQKGASFD